ncbi:MAG: triose-phosphate isomerase [Azospirillum sp.]|nr:triose-phosphate isomerase [Azospirillum sp.]
MAERRLLIAGNWKMNGLRSEAVVLASDLASRLQQSGPDGVDLLLCPPATLVWAVGQVVEGSGVLLGGQDCHAEAKGAHTGDIAAPMLAEAGCGFVIVGHSERRQNHRESDPVVAAKAAAANRAGLTAIICVGETEAERDRGEAKAVVARQLAGSIPPGSSAATTVIAYEPVWAIGTGRSASIGDVAEMHAHIRVELDRHLTGALDVRILYGGSVKPGNARELLALADVDGALVGGASLVADDFWAIALSCR